MSGIQYQIAPQIDRPIKNGKVVFGVAPIFVVFCQRGTSFRGLTCFFKAGIEVEWFKNMLSSCWRFICARGLTRILFCFHGASLKLTIW